MKTPILTAPMNTKFSKNTHLTALLSIIIITFTACVPQIELTSSWTNKQAKVKNSPLVMVMVLGKNLTNRQYAEGYIVNELMSRGYNAKAALDVFKPDAQKYDSATMVTMLKQQNVDMLFTTAVVEITEKETYVPGTKERVPVGTYATPYNPYYNQNNYYINNSNDFYGYYNTYNYATLYETRETPGYTYTDVTVILESKLFSVATPELLWFGQSKSYTAEPTTKLYETFAKIVVDDMVKNNLLVK